MTRRIFTFTLGICLLLLNFSFAVAQMEGTGQWRGTYTKGRFSLTPYAGAVVGSTKDMIETGTASASGAVTFSDGSQFSAAVAATVDEKSFNDMYDTPIVLGFDVGYMLSSETELFGGFRYKHADSGGFQKVGDVTATFTFTDSGGTATSVSNGDTIHGELEDYDSFTMRAGANRYFAKGDFVPFVGGFIGWEHVSEIKAKAKLVTANIQSGFFKFYDTTDTLALGAHTGFNKGLGWQGAYLGMRASADYSLSLNDDDADVGLVNLGSVNNGGDGVDFALSAFVRFPL